MSGIDEENMNEPVPENDLNDQIYEPFAFPFVYYPVDIEKQLPEKYVDELNKQWRRIYDEIDVQKTFKTIILPFSRIKKIMKNDDDTRCIDGSAPSLLERAIEMFVIELTIRAWAEAEEKKRRTLQKKDIVEASRGTNVFDFLEFEGEEKEDIPGNLQMFSGNNLPPGSSKNVDGQLYPTIYNPNDMTAMFPPYHPEIPKE